MHFDAGNWLSGKLGAKFLDATLTPYYGTGCKMFRMAEKTPELLMTIGQLAERSGIGVEAVRFYERKGLLEAPPRKDSGYRQYNESAVIRLRFIKGAKTLGFSLSEIKDLLALRVDQSTTCAEIRSRAEAKLIDIDAKIQTLEAMKKSLLKVTKQCAGRGPTSECPILDAMGPLEFG